MQIYLFMLVSELFEHCRNFQHRIINKNFVYTTSEIISYSLAITTQSLKKI